MSNNSRGGRPEFPLPAAGLGLYRGMFLAAPQGILLLDAKTHEVLDANPAALALLNESGAALMSKSLFEIPFFRGLTGLDRILKQLSGTTYIRYDEVAIGAQTGPATFADITFHSYLAGTKQITECNLYLVTGRKRRQSRDRRVHTMAALTNMAERMAAELNALLPVITASSDVATGPGALVQPSPKALEEVQKARGRLAALARDLLAFSGKQNLQLQAIDVNQQLAAMDVTLGGILGEQIQLVQQLASALPPAKTDPIQFQAVVRTLAAFARNRMPSGGILQITTSLVEPADPVLRDFNAVPGRYVRLTFTDNGNAPDERAWPHLFEPFRGLLGEDENGLAAVYGVVKQSGGHISAAVTASGVQFCAYFPGAESTAAAGRDPHACQAAETIVLFEQEEGLRRVVRNLLARKGYHVLEAESAERMQQILESEGGRVDLVISNMRAAALARRMAAVHPHLKLVHISEFMDDTGDKAGSLPPDAAVLQKPFRLDALLVKIRTVLDNEPSGQ